jgi:hypothetical protein
MPARSAPERAQPSALEGRGRDRTPRRPTFTRGDKWLTAAVAAFVVWQTAHGHWWVALAAAAGYVVVFLVIFVYLVHVKWARRRRGRG